MSSSKRPDTRIVHTGSNPKAQKGVVNPPVYRASTVIFPTVQAMKDAEKNKFDTTFYGVHGTPTQFAFEDAMADLEGGYRAVSVSSGLAAITTALITFLDSGDHLLMVDSVYGPTRNFCNTTLKSFGVETTYYDPMIDAGIEELIKPNTKVIFTESPGSYTFEIQDIPAITKVARQHDIKVMIDNTWAAGYYFKPFDHGVDISIQATTKYQAGHADLIMGHIIANSEKDWRTIKANTATLGQAVSPDACYLGLRGLRTLSVRLEQHQESALTLASWLDERPEVNTILHPAFPSCPGHDIWQRDFTGSSGLFSIILKDFSEAQVNAMLDGMDYFAMGYSWGGFESLMVASDPAKIRSATKWQAAGPLLRLHAGQEDVEDLIADLERGFDRLNGRD
ncbi:MAG: cystathionine beta-lyase [Rhodospirillaceae bacterium]|jgi:cysteine-S-conjugate beta-lyase|nr:cystathionine beta-lyase [Rhodospirillaceae bacterium]